ncbi:unnamed protein product [Paramecium octaurelia]|uniref:Uncharacterized protein n=1 Tax=Paramecium octaurelia TaxID=43137 RepID=A0A8S1VD95_PAROT|nr:unnamed protein product [Paramecium octaurelia]
MLGVKFKQSLTQQEPVTINSMILSPSHHPIMMFDLLLRTWQYFKIKRINYFCSNSPLKRNFELIEPTFEFHIPKIQRKNINVILNINNNQAIWNNSYNHPLAKDYLKLFIYTQKSQIQVCIHLYYMKKQFTQNNWQFFVVNQIIEK